MANKIGEGIEAAFKELLERQGPPAKDVPHGFLVIGDQKISIAALQHCEIARLNATVSTQAGEIADLKDERNALAKACGDAMGRWQEAESQLDNGSGGLFGRDQLLAFKRGFDIMAEISMKLGHPKKLVRAVEKLQKRAEKAEAENARLVEEVLNVIRVHRGSIREGDTAAQVTLGILEAVEALQKDKPHG